MEFVHRAIPHRVRRLFAGKAKEGSGPEDSYRLRRMESHASMTATKRRRIFLNLTPESIENDLDAPNDSLPHYPTNKVTTSVSATIALWPPCFCAVVFAFGLSFVMLVCPRLCVSPRLQLTEIRI